MAVSDKFLVTNIHRYNAVLIEQGKSQSERLVLLHDLAVRQMQTFANMNMDALPRLPEKAPQTESEE